MRTDRLLTVCLGGGGGCILDAPSPAPWTDRRRMRSVNIHVPGHCLPTHISELLGPRIGSSPVRSIVQCLARKEGSDDFYTLKVCFVLRYFGNGTEVQ